MKRQVDSVAYKTANDFREEVLAPFKKLWEASVAHTKTEHAIPSALRLHRTICNTVELRVARSDTEHAMDNSCGG